MDADADAALVESCAPEQLADDASVAHGPLGLTRGVVREIVVQSSDAAVPQVGAAGTIRPGA